MLLSTIPLTDGFVDTTHHDPQSVRATVDMYFNFIQSRLAQPGWNPYPYRSSIVSEGLDPNRKIV